MRTIGKLISLFYGSQMLLSGVGLALFCYLDPNAFADASKESGHDLRLFMLTAGLIPQVGIGLLLVWLGLATRWQERLWKSASKLTKAFFEN